jgi:acyl-CoA thioesterase-1
MRVFNTKRLSVVTLLCVLCTGLLSLAPAAKASETAPVLLVVGDSLSAGFGMDVEDTWTTLLQERLDQKGYGYRVVNASISGDTTGNGLRRLPRSLDIHQPDIVIIELGGNDGLRGLPIEVIRDNLGQMISKSNERGALVILTGIVIPPNYGEDYASEFSALYPSLAEQFDTLTVPFFMDNVALDPSKMQADGIHPNRGAQPILMENVWVVLGPVLAER